MSADEDYGKPNSLLIKNARLIDGLGTVHKDLQCIYVDSGEIIEIGQKISALKSLLWTVKDGQARTPKEWMTENA